MIATKLSVELHFKIDSFLPNIAIQKIGGFMKKLIYLLILILVMGCKQEADFSKFKNGDIIFQPSVSSQSREIKIATDSDFSHMGIIYRQNEKLYVYEAIATVRLTPLQEWIDRGVNSEYIVKRLKNYDELLTPRNLMKIKKIGEKYQGKKYDIYFNWSDEEIYCSELVWKMYKQALGIEIGKLKTFSDFNLSNPLVKKKIKERFGDKLPMDEPVIAPVDMLESDKLETVFKN